MMTQEFDGFWVSSPNVTLMPPALGICCEELSMRWSSCKLPNQISIFCVLDRVFSMAAVTALFTAFVISVRLYGRWVDEPGKISLKGWAESGVKSLVASVDNVLRGVQLLPQDDYENDNVLGKVTAFEDSREHANLSGNRSRLAALHIGLDDDAWIAWRWNNGYHSGLVR